MAASLIDSMTEDFDPDAYHDNYREALQEVVDAKVEGREVVQPEGVSVATEPTSLADALKASLEAARKAPARAGEIKTAKSPRRAIADGEKTRATAAGGARAGGGKDGAANDGAGVAAARSGRSKTGAAPGDEAKDATANAAGDESPRRPPAKEAKTASTSTQTRGRRRAS